MRKKIIGRRYSSPEGFQENLYRSFFTYDTQIMIFPVFTAYCFPHVASYESRNQLNLQMIVYQLDIEIMRLPVTVMNIEQWSTRTA